MKIYLKYTTVYFRTAAESAAVADNEEPLEVMFSTRMAANVQHTTTPAASWLHNYCTPT